MFDVNCIGKSMYQSWYCSARHRLFACDFAWIGLWIRFLRWSVSWFVGSTDRGCLFLSLDEEELTTISRQGFLVRRKRCLAILLWFDVSTSSDNCRSNTKLTSRCIL